jgi:transcription antitermination factor NusG
MEQIVKREQIVSESEDLNCQNKWSETPQSKLWYAVYTIVRHEKAVYSSLINNNIETFLPLREVVSQWKDRRKVVRIPLFPGYVFVRIFDKDSRSILSIFNTKGVVRILSSNGRFQPVPAQQIDSVKRIVETKYEFDPYLCLVKGSEVRIANGPLQGVTGRIVERKGRKWLVVSIDIIKRSVSVTVDPADVELV